MEQEQPAPIPKVQDKVWPEPEFMSFAIPEDIDTSEMTKKQIRKLKKTLFWESKLPEIRAKNRKNIKIKKQKKKEALQKKSDNGEVVDEGEFPEYSHSRGKNFRIEFKKEIQQFQPLIIDCAFENLHKLKDMRSLGNQFSQLLGINRKLADAERLPANAAELGVEAKAFNVYLTGIQPNPERVEYPENAPDLSGSKLNSKQRRRLRQSGKNEKKYELPEDGVIRIGGVPWEETNFGAKGKLSNYLRKRDADGWMLNTVKNQFTDLPFIEGSSCEQRTDQESLEGETVPYRGNQKWKVEDIIYLTGDAEETMGEYDPR